MSWCLSGIIIFLNFSAQAFVCVVQRFKVLVDIKVNTDGVLFTGLWFRARINFLWLEVNKWFVPGRTIAKIMQ